MGSSRSYEQFAAFAPRPSALQALWQTITHGASGAHVTVLYDNGKQAQAADLAQLKIDPYRNVRQLRLAALSPDGERQANFQAGSAFVPNTLTISGPPDFVAAATGAPAHDLTGGAWQFPDLMTLAYTGVAVAALAPLLLYPLAGQTRPPAAFLDIIPFAMVGLLGLRMLAPPTIRLVPDETSYAQAVQAAQRKLTWVMGAGLVWAYMLVRVK